MSSHTWIYLDSTDEFCVAHERDEVARLLEDCDREFLPMLSIRYRDPEASDFDALSDDPTFTQVTTFVRARSVVAFESAPPHVELSIMRAAAHQLG
ncbi:hypothetical protein PAI11_37420 [Patulibacter medicamentivorans]|uniref:Uncharacterized protein n=1 Tax=Patulibacter medicamentivorans TaxID=1097667 RepID=H0EA68_9ACTN|nr:hypothetical protein [Patulibacter medicamentivorans]EHN09408.1 hypothetical protein PAI11_37420 [Patulibacter medicamentivorans]